MRLIGFVLVLTLGLTLAPLAGEAQQADKMPLVGILDGGVPHLFTAFREGLRELGYVEGQNLRLAVKSAYGRPDLIQGLAADLVALKPDVIVTTGTAVRALRRASPTIPIVVAATTDAVASGFTGSLARPADNITGQSFLNTELSAKRLELLKDTLPRARRVAMLVYAGLHTPGSAPDRDVTETRTAAERFGLHLQRVDVRLDDLARSFNDAKQIRADAVDVLASAWFNAHRDRIAELAAQSGLPAIYESRDYVDAGGLMSYGQNLAVLFRRAATYVHKILKGAKPDDLPWEQPAQFELVINLKTAKALGLTIPQSVLLRADHVIQ
jgi:putative tryptophan/tyrosine transport system substrate-binding protein